MVEESFYKYTCLRIRVFHAYGQLNYARGKHTIAVNIYTCIIHEENVSI